MEEGRGHERDGDRYKLRLRYLPSFGLWLSTSPSVEVLIQTVRELKCPRQDREEDSANLII